MSTARKIAMIGTGNVGGNLGATFAKAGFEVKYGVRPEKEAKDGGKALKDLLARSGSGATVDTPNKAAAWADVVVLAVPGTVALDVARELAADLEGKIVIDANNPMTWKEGPVWAPPPEGSLSAAIARIAPGAKVIKAFNTFGSEAHGNPSFAGPKAQVFYAADDADAKKTFAELITTAGYEPIDAGPLRNAAVLENVAMLWIHLALAGGQGRDWVLHMQRPGK